MLEALLELLGLVTAVIVVTAVGRRYALLTPVLLVVVGLAVSFVPGLPILRLDPEVVLFGILPPLVYVAALQTSVPAFRFNLRPILLLAVGLVLFTTVAVGFAVYAIVPGVPLSICFALGAVVAPTDAVAATAVARRIGLPRRVVTVLEGESLVNDGTALVVLRVAAAAALGQAVGALDIAGTAALSAGGGLAVGALGGWAVGWVHRRITDPLLDNSLALVTPFLVYVLAERLHGSGVVAVLVCGLYLGHRMPTLASAASRLQMDAFWRMVTFLLEGVVLLVMGLQLRFILAELTAHDTALRTAALATVVVLAVVIAARVVWVYPATYLPRLLPWVRARDPAPPLAVPAVIGWAGMRGVVTLAAALTLPLTLAGGTAYPRELFVWLAFAVIIGTLVIQGATLPRLARLVRVPADDPSRDALAEAAVQHEASRAARERLEELADGAAPDVVERLRGKLDLRTNMAWERLGSQQRETPSRTYTRLRLAMLEAEREVFRKARDSGRIPEEVLIRAQRDMDLEESILGREDEP